MMEKNQRIKEKERIKIRKIRGNEGKGKRE